MTAEKLDVTRDEKARAPVPAGGAASALSGLRDEFDRLFDRVAGRFWSLPGELSTSFRFDSPLGTTMPAVDVSEADGHYEITAELPGLEAQNVHVSVQNGLLTISGEKSEEKKEEKKNCYLSERRYGSFRRSFQVPDSVDADKSEAKFEKGILRVSLPKTAQAAEKKTIEVKAA
ncbi:Hsp20/alpha crystallin family protein [Lutibaculum baratangense]|uniref:Heat shock protein Hsp20 n=1 Tax=Lutibaculum baratangense AMV1 TaxID=631454 RepID=V4R0F8_9HYPH|nr:Hsp20/alpha crystallin family protein [Lutibaculum baratangense]ESR25457.1 heat shock protein Hsp20 [Lutibaculum baratangense AMV1]